MIYLRHNGLNISLMEVRSFEAEELENTYAGVCGVPIFIFRHPNGGLSVWTPSDRDYTGFDDEGREYLFPAARD